MEEAFYYIHNLVTACEIQVGHSSFIRSTSSELLDIKIVLSNHHSLGYYRCLSGSFITSSFFVFPSL